MPLLSGRSLVRRFGRAHALDGVDVDVHAGEAVALLGPNGAGKTTLLRILAGVDDADAGQLERPAGRIAWVPQRPAVYPRLSVRENLEFFAALAPGGADPVSLMERADLARYSGRRADRLSTGTLQRLNIAAALTGTPSVLLLDEPTSTLSPDQRLRLWGWLGELRDAGLALVFSTQSVGEASRHAHRCVVIAHGHSVFDGAPAELAARGDAPDPHDALQRAFLDLVRDPDAEATA